MTILVIPAEGDYSSTEFHYVEQLKDYNGLSRKGIDVKVFDFFERFHDDRHVPIEEGYYFHDGSGIRPVKLSRAVQKAVQEYFAENLELRVRGELEIHAQGGFGAFVAYTIIRYFPKAVKRVFFIGGAPSRAMTPIAKVFHRHLSKLWYYIPFFDYFADDPNPYGDPDIDEIKQSSTRCMRADPKLYRDQLVLIGTWNPDYGWTMPADIEGWFVPNGDTVRAAWLDNTYNNDLASSYWLTYGVKTTSKPGHNFSFYSLMPGFAVFSVMNEVREL